MPKDREYIREAKRIRESDASGEAGHERYNGQDKYMKCFDTYIAYTMTYELLGQLYEIPMIREETV